LAEKIAQYIKLRTTSLHSVCSRADRCTTNAAGALTGRGRRSMVSSTSRAAMAAPDRAAMKEFWQEHSQVASVEAMMLDSQASAIDKEERPEVR